jgi:hypothetical protein
MMGRFARTTQSHPWLLLMQQGNSSSPIVLARRFFGSGRGNNVLAQSGIVVVGSNHGGVLHHHHHHHHQARRRSNSSMASSPSSETETLENKPPAEHKQDSNYVPLKHIPSLPFVGSMIPQYSGITMELDDATNVWIECRKKFGDFYTIGIPGIGAGVHGTLYMVQDPHEMAKVIRVEGKYPTSSVQDLWPFQQVQIDAGITPEKGNGGGGIMGHGEEWRRIRSFMQTDLLAPKSANRYLPGILKATKYCSHGLPKHKHDVNHFLQLASFDMFCSVLLGARSRNQSRRCRGGR